MADTYTPVNGPEYPAVPFGLFSVLTFRGNDDRWENGIQFPTGNNEPQVQESLDCENPNGAVGYPIQTHPGVDWSQFDPFSVTEDFTCSPVGYSTDDAERLAAESLQRREEFAVERYLWNQWTKGDNTAEPIETTGDGFDLDISSAIGIAEQAALAQYSGAVIHLPRWMGQVAKNLKTNGMRITTQGGIPVVLGSGYLGNEFPDTRIVVTSPMVAYRSQIEILGDTVQQFDRGQNVLSAIAQRTYLVGWESSSAQIIDTQKAS